MAASAPTIGSIFRTRELSTNMIITTDPTAEIVQYAGDGQCYSEQVTKINPISPFSLGKKFLTLNSSEGDGVKSHDLRNLVSHILEEDCNSTFTPLDLWVKWSTRNTDKIDNWLMESPVVIIKSEVQRDEMTYSDKLPMYWELGSILSCEERSNMEDFEPIDDL